MAQDIKIKIVAIDGITKSLKEITQSLKNVEKTSQKTAEEMEKVDIAWKKGTLAAAGLTAAVGLQSRSVRELLGRFSSLIQGISKLNPYFGNFTSNLRGAGKVTGVLAKTAFALNKGILGLTVNLGSVSAVLLSVGRLGQEVDNKFIKFASTISIVAGIITGTLSFALGFAIVEGGKLVNRIGTDLVRANIEATNSFIQLEKKVFVFTRTLKGFNKAYGTSIGTAESWVNVIERVSRSTGFSEEALRGAVTEIVATTSAMGFNERQMKQLLDVSTDYASFLGTDLVQTTLDFVAALNGNSRSVQKYGIKVSDTNVKQSLLNKGIRLNFERLKENDKAQIRFNKILGQYGPIAGNAVAVTQTLAGQQKVLENNLSRLQKRYGEGAAIIEGNNILNLATNTILNNVSDSVVKFTGFVGALGARLLQIGGLFLEWSLKILLVIKGIKLLNVILTTTFAQAIFGLPIPFLNKSLIDLIKLTGANFVSFSSLTNIIKTVASVLKAQLLPLLGSVAKAVGRLSLQLLKLAFNPVVLTIIAIVASIYVLIQALKFIEERTGVFSTLWEVLNEVFSATSTIVEPIVAVFTKLSNVITNFLSKAFGYLLDRLSKTIRFFIRLAKLNPFNIFDNKQIKKLENANKKMLEFEKTLKRVDFDFRKLKKKGVKVEVEAPKVTAPVEPFQEGTFGKLFEDFKTLDFKAAEFGAKVNDAVLRLPLSLAASFTEGKSGARKLATGIVSSVADAFLPGLGQVAGPIFDLLAQGPEATKAAIREFTLAIPEILENVILALPALAEGFADALPLVIQRLADRADDIVIGFIKAFIKAAPKLLFPFLTRSLRNALFDAAKGFTQALIIGASRFIQALISSISGGVSKTFGLSSDSGFVELLKDVTGISTIQSIASGDVRSALEDVTGVSAIKSIGRSFGLAQGGLVPSGFRNDTFPAKLTSGEYVIDRSLTSRLSDYLDGNSPQSAGGSGVTNEDLLRAIYSPMVIQSDFKMNDEAFGRAILRVNRQNIRTK